MKTELHNGNVCAEGLGQFHVGSLDGGSVFVGCYGPRLVDSIGFLVESRAILTGILSDTVDIENTCGSPDIFSLPMPI